MEEELYDKAPEHGGQTDTRLARPDKVGQHVVNICIPGNGDFRVTGSVDNVWTSSKVTAGTDAYRGRSSHVTDLGQSWLDHFRYDTASQLVTRTGFSIKRFLPRTSDPDLANAYFLERHVTQSLDAWIHRTSERDQEIPPIKSDKFPIKPPPSLTNGDVTGSMSEGATNPAFKDDDDNHVTVTHFGADTETVTLPKTAVDVGKKTEVAVELEPTVQVADDAKPRTDVQKSDDIVLDVDTGPEKPNVDDATVTSTTATSDMKLHSQLHEQIHSPVDSKMNGDALQLEDLEATPQKAPRKVPPPLRKGMSTIKLLESMNKAAAPPPDAGPSPATSVRSWLFTFKDWRDEDTKWLEWIGAKFREIAGDDGEIDLQEFKKALGVKKSFFAERFFALFDQDDSGTIELGELMDGMRMLMKGSPAQKLQFLFDVYDADGSGSIERDELAAVLKGCMEESSLSLSDDALDELTDVLFDAADQDDSGTITFDELRTELEKNPGVIENLTISAANWLKPPDQSKDGKPRFRYFTSDYIRNNLRKVCFFFFYWAVNIALFAVAVWQYRAYNGWVQVARGCGLCLNFNCMWVLVLMLRKCITFLRMTKLTNILPLDQHIFFHKMTGIAIAGFSIVHSIAHIVNAGVTTKITGVDDDDDDDDDGDGMKMWEMLFTTKAGVGYVGYSAFITGWILDVVLVVMVICSLPFVRRSGHFQVFYWSHMLYIPFWILVILHGPHFWKWFVLPGTIFIVEKISRSKLIKMARFGDTFIEEVNLLSSGVTHLMISRPMNFKYQPGDYLFIQIPAIAKQEWHPFTISSAPEMEGRLWLHVRSAGHWTNKLYKYFSDLKVDEEENVGSINRKFNKFERALSRRQTTQSARSTRVKKQKAKNKIVKVKCYLDGPYGTGTREVFDTQHAVLIGAGIGVTPMASILQSVWYRFSAVKQTCPSCQHAFYSDGDGMDMKLRKLDFIWINRDQRSFEWFLTLLSQIELEQSECGGALDNCIEFHMYMTAAQKKTDMKGIGLQIALDLIHEKTQKDMITGLKTRTEPGRPDWNKVFKKIESQNKGKVKVFFCGAPALGKTIKESCARFNFSFSKENF